MSKQATPSKKRAAGDDAPQQRRDKNDTQTPVEAGDDEDLEFEDPYGDEMDDDEEVDAVKTSSSPLDDEPQDDEDIISEGDEEIIQGDENNENNEEAAADEKKKVKYVWRPGSDALSPDEQLDYDSSAYNLLHRMQVEWPCLSFDILKDDLGDFRMKYPHTAYFVAGTQADSANKNKLMVLKVSDLHRTKNDDRDDDDDDEESDDEDLDEDPIVEEKSIAHQGGVNRIRTCPQHPHLIATHADTAKVHIWNIAPLLSSFTTPSKFNAKPQPLFTFSGGVQEGYSMAWNPRSACRLVTGDGAKNIWLWDMKEGGKEWNVDKLPFKGHSSSVEDLCWSPSETDVFASCSSDKTIRMWDTRVKDRCMAWVAAHKTDVNVIDWNKKVQHLLVSGADDGSIKIWDLRNFKSNSPAANFSWHRNAITSVEWHPHEESCVAVSSADDSLTIWDMALEHDEMPGTGAQLQEELPPQLFFVHQGQKQIKELHWHQQIPNMIISTAEDGFNIFKPSNLE